MIALALFRLLKEKTVELSGHWARLAIADLLAIQTLNWDQMRVTREQHDLHSCKCGGHRHRLLPNLTQEATLLDQMLSCQLHGLPHGRARQDVVKGRGHECPVRRDEGGVDNAALGNGVITVHEDAEAAAMVLCCHGCQAVQHVVVALHPGQQRRLHRHRAHEDFIDCLELREFAYDAVHDAIEGWLAAFTSDTEVPWAC
mmetsp:Transcript_20526/g.57741  ORF Transcript_20526/g.57741 Transcript_20526/m.57741 type:complete len:200 (-) Transcript_20526:526-1125(-)